MKIHIQSEPHRSAQLGHLHTPTPPTLTVADHTFGSLCAASATFETRRERWGMGQGAVYQSKAWIDMLG